jgi:hypothetical protein
MSYWDLPIEVKVTQTYDKKKCIIPHEKRNIECGNCFGNPQ